MVFNVILTLGALVAMFYFKLGMGRTLVGSVLIGVPLYFMG